MPLFTDRHDVPGVTAEDAADALARENTLEAVHRESPGLVPHEIIDVSHALHHG
jgi:hypothetical protein